jgi:hypothetical protein
MQGDMPDGSFSAAELERLKAEGILELHQPGTPEHAAARQQIRAEIEVADAEALAIHGPDALTSARMLRQMALVCELDPERVGHAFAAWCRSRGWERADLASWLGVTIDQLAALAIERRGLTGCPEDGEHGDLAERYGADADRLAAVLAA